VAIYYGKQLTFSDLAFQEIIDPNHKLSKLAAIIVWAEIHGRLYRYYSKVGRQGLPIRLMVGLHFLKHMENMSDSECVNRIRGDLDWMAFCGVDASSLKDKFAHLERTSMIKFRNRIGVKGFAEVEAVIIEYLVKEKHIDKKQMCTDSTSMEKNVAYPLDSHLLSKGRENLLKGIRKLEECGVKGIDGLRTYSRRAKQIIINLMKLGKDRADRIEAGTLELASQAVHMIHQCEEAIKSAEKSLARGRLEFKDSVRVSGTIKYLNEQAALLRRVITQARKRFEGEHIPNKVYSLHEPQVIVIRKGKRSKTNEYGSKVNISICKNGFIGSHELYHQNHHDAELLEPALKNWEEKVGELPKQVNADRGYQQKEKNLNRGKVKHIDKLCIPKKGKTKHPDHDKSWFRNGQKRRAGIEAVIGHLKQDHRLGKCYYSGYRGDGINLTLGCSAWNLGKLARVMG
jgi:IS5 family transposase